MLSEQDVATYLGVYDKIVSRYWLVVFPLFIAGIGQGVLWTSLIAARVSPRFWAVGLAIALTPWLVCFAATLASVPPPVSPRTFRRLLLWVVYWYATTTALLAVTVLAGMIPWGPGGAYAFNLVCAVALLGWVAVPTLVQCSRATPAASE